MKKSLSQYAKYGNSEYAKTLYKWGKRNPNKIKKIIDDLYKKSFPNGQEDVIKFQSRYIDELKNFIKKTEIEHDIELEIAQNTNRGFDYENPIYNDSHQTVVEGEVGNLEYVNPYLEQIGLWRSTKTEQQQKIWKLYNQNLPKKEIARKLNKDPKYIRVTIKNLEKSFTEELSKTATLPNYYKLKHEN